MEVFLFCSLLSRPLQLRAAPAAAANENLTEASEQI